MRHDLGNALLAKQLLQNLPSLAGDLRHIWILCIALLEICRLESVDRRQRIGLCVAAWRQEPIDEPIRCTGPVSSGRMRSAITRSSWLSTSHLAPPEAPAIVPICSAAKPLCCTSAKAEGPALKSSAFVLNCELPSRLRSKPVCTIPRFRRIHIFDFREHNRRDDILETIRSGLLADDRNGLRGWRI